MLQELKEKGLAVPEPLALAEDQNGASWLFMRFIPSISLDQLDASKLSPRDKNFLIKEMAALVRGLHYFGIQDPDRHGGNFLVDKENRIWTIDFHRASQRKHLSWKDRQHDLVTLAASLSPQLEIKDQLRFLRSYLKEEAVPKSFFKSLARETELAARLWRQKILHKKAQKACQAKGKFENLSIGKASGFHRKGRPFSQEDLEKLVAKAGRWDDSIPFRVIKKGSKTLVLESTRKQNPFVVKIYFKNSPFSRMRSALGFGRARRAWKNAYHLELAQTASARPIALLEANHADYLISEKIDSAGKVEHKAQFMNELSALVARIHLAGLRARDLKAENILWEKNGEQFRAKLVDFDGIRKLQSDSQRQKDFARLFRSFPDTWQNERTEFLKKYGKLIPVPRETEADSSTQ